MPSELKDTLNLPKTSFAMKANLPQNEPKRLEFWKKIGIYQRIREARKGAPKYHLHDGPPYANGEIHLGHALNKSLKDFVVKSKTMAGFDAPYIPGWDCHGLPIEIKVDEKLGRKKLEMAPTAVRRACREYAEKYLNLQSEQFQRIGVFGDFEHPYSTMSPQYESVIARVFFDFWENGFVYKGLRPVYWCIVDRTALAEAEVEYEQHTSPSVWVKYALTSKPEAIDPALAGKCVNTIIWTTTPWTLPASMAVAFHPAYDYVALEDAGNVYIIAEGLLEATREHTGLQNGSVIARFPGRKLEGTTFQHPFLDRKILGVLADYVTLEQGTGAVHTAPSHGTDDFYTGVKYGLDQTCNVDAEGRLRNGLPEYNSKTVFEANQPIIELLKARHVLMGEEKITHSYPHCWRCHNPVIFRATEQWFIGMESPMHGSTLRERAREEIRKTEWDPAWGEERISNMVAMRPDWCISRQRVWGVPIPIFFCQGCNQPLRSKEANEAVVKLFAAQGADAWYTRNVKDIVPANVKCQNCGAQNFRKEFDIIDVWFESGSSWAVVMKDAVADMYIEGGDQHRGWFQSSLLCSVGTRNRAPYRLAVTCGWTLDPQGRAMSKSLGNGVDPVEVAEKLGAEIVRLWVASVDFREDMHASDELMRRVADNYRDIRNAFRWILGNLDGFNPAQDQVPFEETESIDQYMLLLTSDLVKDVLRWYEQFEFHRIYQRLIAFRTSELSNFYFDVLKDRLYTYPRTSCARRSGQTAIWRIGQVLVRLVAPIMSFTAEEVWEFMPFMGEKPESVHLALFPTAEEVLGNTERQPDRQGQSVPSDTDRIRADWQRLLLVREEVFRALETARKDKVIGSGLQAKVAISAPLETHGLLEKYFATLRYLFIVSQVELQQLPSNGNGSGLKIEVSPADGTKCERCWNYSTQVGSDAEYPTVCERCSAALHEMEDRESVR
ncbi:MAG: isoleucine--tRNA ligase [Acidobacteria bacterium]|nr:MAG: isoleucine--tRNA ligase [Acidobacteriota bacterium]